MNKLLFIATFFIALFSCKHEPVVDINPEPNPNDTIVQDTTGQDTMAPCDSTIVYFVNEVLPVFQSSCATTGCHDAVSAQEGIILDSYQNIMSSGAIVPNNSANSEIYQVLNETGNDLMPPAYSGITLTQEQINLIGEWIDQGANNNECVNMCDTTHFAFAANVKPLIDASCLSCHSASSASGGVNLSTYNNIIVYVNNGKLLSSIKHDGNASPMPKNSPKWADCKIKIVENIIRGPY